MLVACLLSSKELLDCMLDFPELPHWIEVILLHSPEKQIREMVVTAIQQLCDNVTDELIFTLDGLTHVEQWGKRFPKSTS